MITPDPNPKMFMVRNPEGKTYSIPEHNLDKAIELGGEVIDDDMIMNQSSQPSIQSQTNFQSDEVAQNTQNPQNQQQMFKVRNPKGEIYNIPESNLKKALDLGGQVIDDTPDEYSGKNPGAAFAKNVGAGVVGAIPDTAIGLYNLYNLSVGSGAPLPYVTDKISSAIDKATNDYTKDTGPKSKHAARFLGSLFGAGYVGKGVQALGSAGKAGAASKGLEKTGSFITNNLGVRPGVSNATGALASGAAVGFAEENDIPFYWQVPLAIGAFVLGHGVGNKASSTFKNSDKMKSLYEAIPGLEQLVNRGHYKDLSKLINEKDMRDLMKNSLIESEGEFLSQKVISELPPEIQTKLKTNPGLLKEDEIKLIIDKGQNDYNKFISELEDKYFPLTTGEATGSAEVIAKEDALANKPKNDVFDRAMSNRRSNIAQRIEQIKHDLGGKNLTSGELGEKIAKEVEDVYSKAYKLRASNWTRRFGKAADENILSIDDYVDKLKEFSKLRPDNEGNIVAIKAATRKLKDGIEFEKKISPKRFNDILVGLNDDIRRFPDKTFSQKQTIELKKTLEESLTKNIENAPTAEQASIIRNARAGYSKDSELIDQLDESILFNKIKKEQITVPEKVASALDKMEPSQLKLTLDALKRSSNYQEILPEIQTYYLNRAFEAAIKEGRSDFNVRTFLNNLPKKEQFDIIFDGSNAYQEIKDISILLKRVKKFQPVRGNSKTGQRLQADRGDLEEHAEMAVKASNGDVTGLIKNLLGKLSTSSYDKRISELLISPRDRKEILKELKNKTKSEKRAVFVHSVTAPRSEKKSKRKRSVLSVRPNIQPERYK